ncbi:MAG: glycosyltransferase [Alphaproteobacteria bacterium]
MLVTLVDDSIPYNGMTPAYQPLGGAEKAFASLPSALARAGHVVRVINRTPNAMGYENVSWVDWDGRRPPITEVLIAFRKPRLLEFVRATTARILWLTGPAGYLDKPQVTDMLKRTEARLVFLGRTHQETYTGTGESSLRYISPGVREEYREAEDMEPSDVPTAIVTTHPKHGLDWLLDIWTTRIYPKVPNAELHIYSAAFMKADAGDTLPDELDEIYRKVIAAEQNGIVIKPPAGDRDMSQSYRRARVHLYPGSDKEMYCSTLAESQAVGVPAVARPMGAVKERVIGDKSAFLTDGESDFADHAIRMLSDDDEFKSASIVARRHGRSRSWDTTASEFETIFR